MSTLCQYRSQRKRIRNGAVRSVSERKEEIRKVGSTTIVLARDDTPFGHSGLPLRLVRGIEYYENAEQPKSPPPSSMEKSVELTISTGPFGELDTPARRRLKELGANRLKKQNTVKQETQKGGDSDAHLVATKKAPRDDLHTSVSEISHDPSLDPLNNFNPTKDRFACKTSSLLGHDTSESDVDLFGFDESFANHCTNRGTDPSLANANHTETPYEPQSIVSINHRFPNNASPQLPPSFGSLGLKDTLPRHPPNKAVSRSGIGDWGKLMELTRNPETSENKEQSSTNEDDSMTTSTMSSGSALQPSLEETFAQLDLGNTNNGIRMISRKETMDEDDSTGLHNRKALTEKLTESKRQNVVFSGIHALKSLGSEMIKKADPAVGFSYVRKPEGARLPPLRSASSLDTGAVGDAAPRTSALLRAKSTSFRNMFLPKPGRTTRLADDDDEDDDIAPT